MDIKYVYFVEKINEIRNHFIKVFKKEVIKNFKNQKIIGTKWPQLRFQLNFIIKNIHHFSTGKKNFNSIFKFCLIAKKIKKSNSNKIDKISVFSQTQQSLNDN